MEFYVTYELLRSLVKLILRIKSSERSGETGVNTIEGSMSKPNLYSAIPEAVRT